MFCVPEDIYRMLPHEKVELEHKFAQWAETNPELIPKPPKDQKEKDWGGDEPKVCVIQLSFRHLVLCNNRAR